MKVYCMFCLDPFASFEPVPVGVLVKSGFGRDDGSGATKLVSVLNEEDGQLLLLEGRQGGMAGFQLVFVTRTRRRRAHVREGELEGIIHLELFVGVEHGAHLLQKGVQSRPTLKPFVGCQTAIIVSVGKLITRQSQVHAILGRDMVLFDETTDGSMQGFGKSRRYVLGRNERTTLSQTRGVVSLPHSHAFTPAIHKGIQKKFERTGRSG